MGFRNDAYAKIWKIKKPEGKRYAEVELSVSKKVKDSDPVKYETVFSNKFVRFIGSAFDQIDTIKEGDRIKISSTDVESWFNKEKGTGGNTFMVFGFEPADQNGGTKSANTKPAAAADDDDDEVPF